MEKVFVCKNCNLIWNQHELVEGKTKAGKAVRVCPQDGGFVRNVTNSGRGRRFIAMQKKIMKGKILK